MQCKSIAVGSLMVAAVLSGGTARSETNAALTPATIDHLIRQEWKKQNIVPARPVDEAGFLRRVTLDITGTIPTPEAIRAFLADRSPDKRTKVVESLLNDPRYAENWTNYWEATLLGRNGRLPFVDRVEFRDWLHRQFERNEKWNRIVYNLLTATGTNSTGGSYAKSIGLKRPDDRTPASVTPAQAAADGQAAPINGAVNWILKFRNSVPDLSGTASKLFLGVQIQCAQCHDHKTEKWKQSDFQKFTACFMTMRPRVVDQNKGGVRVVDVEDTPRRAARGKGKGELAPYIQATPSALDGTTFSESDNARQALANWIVADSNPWFAEAIVNRLWAHFLGRGFVEPIDDFRPSNPSVLPGLLSRLAEDFKAGGYDIKRLISRICSTQVYQLSSAPAPKSDPGNTLWARYRLKAMDPGQLVDSLVAATNMTTALEKVAGDRMEEIKFQIQRQFSFFFDVDEEFEHKDFEGTIPAVLLLLNGNMANRGVTPIPGSTLETVFAMPDDDSARIEALYLRTLSRKPTPAEIKRWIGYLNAPRQVVSEMTVRSAPEDAKMPRKKRTGPAPDPLNRLNSRLVTSARSYSPKQQAYEDLFWALLNSSEFIFNH